MSQEIHRSRRSLLAFGSASGIAMTMALASPAFAQDAEPDSDAVVLPEPDIAADDVIVVNGFRAALQSAQGIKQRADTFVDVISAEDIGALPDRSVAEALQRVPGVNIGRFEKTTDPDRFSVEGTGVIVRGLPFVRSELNGRDIFSATGGNVLSFNDVSPELLGRVEVFKNVTADMIDGGIAGTVNLVTRKPLDSSGLNIAGTIEATVGDLAQRWSPGFSVLGSNTWETGAGTFGLQLGYAQSRLISRTDASQVTDPCYRLGLGGGDACVRAQTVVDGGFSGSPVFNASNFPPAGARVVPKGAGVRTTELERDRRAYSAVAQYETSDGRLRLTGEYLRAETEFFTDEYAMIAQVNNDGETPEQAPGSNWTFDENGVFQNGILTLSNFGGYASPFGGIRTETVRFQRGTEASTEDVSFDVDFSATDRLRFNFEAQHISSRLSRDSVIGAMNTWADIALDLSQETPSVQFLKPTGAPDDYFTSGDYSYYWFLLDSLEQNQGSEDSLRFDAEYDISDEGFFRSARFGARWSDRSRVTRDTNFSTWGNLSAPWAGRAGCAPWGATSTGAGCGFTPGRLYTGLPGQEFATGGGAFTDDFPNYSQARSPFSDGFQRGEAPAPIGANAAWFFGGDDFLGEYLAGDSKAQAQEINAFSVTPNPFFGVQGRQFTNAISGETVACDPFCPPEISDATEITKSAYARVDYGHDFDGGISLEGNFGLRYVQTTVRVGGLIGFPNPFFFDSGPGGNGDGTVQVSEIQQSCLLPAPGGAERGYCGLSAARLAEFAAAHTGEVLVDDRDIKFDHWLPSFNARLDVGDGLLFRFAVSKNISRPDLQLFRAGGFIGDNTGNLLSGGNLDSGPLFQLSTGNRNLRPVESWNYDASAEWYFNAVGSLTFSLFMKDITGFVNTGTTLVNYTSDSGVALDVEVNGPANDQGGTLKGFEITHQQVYDFLPGFLDGLGTQFTYTYVDGSDFSPANINGGGNALGGGSFVSQQPLAGISKNTVNATIFYEKGPLSLRAAYNWRSDFLITPRDDIWPYSPIWQESTGQLDASIFYDLTDNVKIGIQAVNLTDEVTRTSQVIDFSGTRVTRSAFRNDRRYTFLARFNF